MSVPSGKGTIQKYCLLDLKVAADEQASRYFQRLGFKEDHTLYDTKLFLGYFGALVALVDFYFTWQKTFKEVVWISKICVPIYFISAAALYYVSQFKIGKTIYTGELKNKKGTITMKTFHKLDEEFQPTYQVTLLFKSTAGVVKEKATELKFSTFFTENGILYNSRYHKQLDALINEVVGDNKNE